MKISMKFRVKFSPSENFAKKIYISLSYCGCDCVWVIGNGGRLEYENSMVVSMEINGLMYQGVLFAQQQHPHRI